MKKLLTLVLALVMIMSLATTAFAVEVTITDNTVYPPGTTEDQKNTFTYYAYKLMDATVSDDGLNYSYVVNTKYQDALISALGLEATADSKAIVEALGEITDRSENMHHFANDLYRAIQADGLEQDQVLSGKGTITATMEEGYWLIVDVTDLENTQYANSLVMVDTVGNEKVTINNKPDSTTTVKKVDDENDSLLDPELDNEDDADWQDVADYDIGDSVPYAIAVYMSNDIAEYNYYSFVMGDWVEEGLTYNEDSFNITVNGVPATLEKAGTDAAETAAFVYELETDVDAEGVQTAQRLYVYPNYDYTNNAGEEVTANKVDGGDFLQYFPEGTDHAVLNSSVVVFTYECILNENAVIGIEGNPNDYTLKFTNNPYDDGFGQTPVDTNIVLTYKVIVNKVDPNGNALTGAEFTLYKFRAIAAVADMTDEEGNAAGYFKHPAANAWGVFEEVDTVEVNDAGTVFNFNGLDDGYYKLVETKVPDGYNKIDDIEFHIEATHVKNLDGTDILTSLEGTTKVGGELTFTPDLGEGSLTADVENHSGTELPSTGGVGTTLFYVFGGLMAVGAAVLLVTKKRMAA